MFAKQGLINFCTVVATAVAALTTTINFCTVVATAIAALTTTINFCIAIVKLAYPARNHANLYDCIF